MSDHVAIKTPVLTGIPFKAEDCLANPSFNPQGKSLDEVQMRQLQNIIDKWRDADRNLFDECETQRFALNDIKLDNGDWIPLRTGEKVHSAPGSISSSIQVDRDGMKQIVIYPGQFAPLDDAITRRAESLQGARIEIIRSIAAN